MIKKRSLFCALMIFILICPVKNIFPQNKIVGNEYSEEDVSTFCKNLNPKGRILETEGYYVWCVAPIYGDDGLIHVFYSRWEAKYGMGGWIHQSEIAHAVAEKPEGPYRYVETVLKPRPGYWDATTCHNPHIQKIKGKYYLFYMGNSNGKTVSTR